MSRFNKFLRCITSENNSISPRMIRFCVIPMITQRNLVGMHTSMNIPLSRLFSEYRPTSRKKSKALDSDNQFDLSDEEYMFEVSALFSRIRIAVEPIFSLNPGYSIEADTPSDSLTINVGRKGTYRFQADVTRQMLVLHSPISGVLQYSYDKVEKQWLGVADRHDLRGLLTRDLIRHSAGLPLFD